MSLKFGKTIRTLSLSQNYLVLIKKKSVVLEFLNFSTSVVLVSYKPVSYKKKNVYSTE